MMFSNLGVQKVMRISELNFALKPNKDEIKPKNKKVQMVIHKTLFYENGKTKAIVDQWFPKLIMRLFDESDIHIMSMKPNSSLSYELIFRCNDTKLSSLINSINENEYIYILSYKSA